MEPSTGRLEPPAPARPRRRTWPLVLALIALAGLAFLVPVIAVWQALQHVSLFGGSSMTLDQQREQAMWITVGAISAGAGLVAAIVAIAASRAVAPRVIGGFAIALSLLTGGVLGLSSWAANAALPPEAATPQVDVPDCGPGSQPTVFGGDDRYTACPEDLATGQAFADAIIGELPTTDVTTASIERFAQQVAEDGESVANPATATADYVQVVDGTDGSLLAVWVAAPVTCAILTWDGGAWTSEVVGLLADGGCVYTGG